MELERTDLGRIAVEDGVLDGLVVAAAVAVDGVRVSKRGRRLRVHADGGAVTIEIAISAEGGLVLPVVGQTVQRRIAEALAAALGEVAAHVDVSIESVYPAGAGR